MCDVTKMLNVSAHVRRSVVGSLLFGSWCVSVRLADTCDTVTWLNI
jgi:hypothetical protein